MDLLLSKCPPNSPGKCTGGQRCPETACATMSSALQAVMVQPKVREGAVPQVRRAPRGTGVHDSSANLGRCSSFHTAPLLLQVAQGKPGARQNRGQVWDVLWSSCHLSLITTQLRAREEQLSPCTYTVHQTYQRSNVTATPVNKVGQSQPWGTQEPSHQL